MNFAVLGAGGWGTAFARLLANAGHETTLWARDVNLARALDKERENKKYLPEVLLPTENLQITSSLPEVISADVIVIAVPSFAVNDLMDGLVGINARLPIVINLAKGLDQSSGKTMSQIIANKADAQAIFTLSGPSHAEEVGRDIPTAVVLAGEGKALAGKLQRAISTPRFRVYLSSDIQGVEVCSAVKNIIALASGVCDGLGYGDNSKAALITRGLTELVRFGKVFGVEKETLSGLAGLGDLVATCTSEHSRNRKVGHRIGQGESVDEILSEMDMVAEGVYATETVHGISRKKNIEMPITTAVWKLLHSKEAPEELVDEIMTRKLKWEDVS